LGGVPRRLTPGPIESLVFVSIANWDPPPRRLITPKAKNKLKAHSHLQMTQMPRRQNTIGQYCIYCTEPMPEDMEEGRGGSLGAVSTSHQIVKGDGCLVLIPLAAVMQA
jgi:hypothetical protein